MILNRKINFLRENFWCMGHFGGIYRFFAIWFQKKNFHSHSSKRLFSKSCKTPKTAENRNTIKTKVVELGILVYRQPFKIWKNEKIFFEKKFFYQNDIQKKFWPKKSKIEFDTSKWPSRWVDYDYGRFFSVEKFLGHFWSIFWSGSGVGPIRPYIYIRASRLYIV